MYVEFPPIHVSLHAAPQTGEALLLSKGLIQGCLPQEFPSMQIQSVLPFLIFLLSPVLL